MAIIDLPTRSLYKREDAASSTPAALEPVVNTHLPTSVKALAGVIVVFGLVVLGEFYT